MTFGKPFEPGREKTGGRKLGVRNKLSERFLKDLHDKWERSGQDTLKILAKENPEAFARLAVGILPREFEGLPPAVVVYTGVQRGDEGPAVASPPIALPPPKAKEPEAEACPLMTADLVAPLPKASDITEAQPAVEKPAFNRWLHYISTMDGVNSSGADLTLLPPAPH